MVLLLHTTLGVRMEGCPTQGWIKLPDLYAHRSGGGWDVHSFYFLVFAIVHMLFSYTGLC